MMLVKMWDALLCIFSIKATFCRLLPFYLIRVFQTLTSMTNLFDRLCTHNCAAA